MRLQLTVVEQVVSPADPPVEVEVEVEVEAAPGSTAAELARALGGTALCVGGARIEPTSRVGVAPLLDGAAVTLVRDDAAPVARDLIDAGPPPRTVVELAVAHGPDAGRTLALGPGLHTLGRGSDASIVIDD